MTAFLSVPGNYEFRGIFKRFTVTVVCDDTGLSGAQSKAFEAYQRENTVEQITWDGFLRRTRRMHEDFLKEAERQKALAIE